MLFWVAAAGTRFEVNGGRPWKNHCGAVGIAVELRRESGEGVSTDVAILLIAFAVL